MKIVRGLRNISTPPKIPIVTLGNFDGTHVGHQAIFKQVLSRAEKLDGTSVVYTFDPHPLKILAPEHSLSLLCSFKKKMELIASYGIDMVVCADFTRAFASLHPRDFAMKIYNGLKPETVIVGHDYSFGQGRAGSIEYLHKMGRELGFRLEVVEPVVMNDKRVSSTLIRNLLSRGEVASANNLLNRCYSIDGRVVSGYKRGKSLGFPTANLDTPFEVIPAVGVYSVYVRAADTIKLLDGVANIGYNPTFNRDDLIVEVHILDFEGDFYGSELELYFVDRLRDEKSFNGVEELKSQIARDVNKTREILDEYRLSDHCVDPRIT